MTPSRRDFLASAAAGTLGVAMSATTPGEAHGATCNAAPAAAPARAAVKPFRLRPGDTVGVVAPSGVKWEPVDVQIVVESFEALGLKTKVGGHVLDRRGYLAGTDADRASDLNAMFADPEVRAVHAIRGGWGAARLLPLLDFDAIARHPKPLTGYSDITALLLPVHARTGLVTFHGPNADSKWNPFNVAWFRRVVMDGEAVTFENLKEKGDLLTQVENRVQTITPGTARGRLLGGNLTVLTALLGSGYLPGWEGCVLFIEDVEEAPYRIDRMLTQLKLAGVLGKASGVIWGTCSKCEPGETYGSLTITDILGDHVKPLGVPAWQGAMIGHAGQQFTLPIGLDVEIDASAGTIRMLEPAVA